MGSEFLGRDAGLSFHPFFTTKNDGLGMGLAIARSILESHAGTIAVKNADGGGARFEIVLPANGPFDVMRAKLSDKTDQGPRRT